MNKLKQQWYRITRQKTRVGKGQSTIAALLICAAVLGAAVGCGPSSHGPGPTSTSQPGSINVPAHQATATARSGSPSASPPGTAYISVSGQNFVENNMLIRPYGSTMYPHWTYNGALHRGGGWAIGAFKSYIDQIVGMAQQAHLNTLRPTNYFDGVAYGDWYNTTVWSNMDYLFQQATLHGMFVILDLSSFRDKTLKQGIYPYDPSLYTTAFSWVAARYASSRALLYYAIAGEVKCPTSSDPLRPASAQDLTNYYRVLSDTLHAADPNHLISSGGLSYLNESHCGIDWQSIFSLPHIEMATIHVYSANDRNITMPLVSAWAASARRPFVIEEFGFLQGDGDATRAAEYQNMYSLGKQYGAAAIIFWNLGPEIGPSSYEVSPATPLTWRTIIQNAPQ